MRRFVSLLLVCALLCGLFCTVAEETPAPQQMTTQTATETQKEETEHTVTQAPQTQQPTEKPQAEVTPTPTPSPTPTAEPEVTASPEATPTVEAEVTSSPEATIAPEATITPEVTLAPETDTEAQTSAEPDLSPSPEPTPAAEEEEDQAENDEHLEDGALKIVSTNPYMGWTGVTPSSEQGMPIPMLFQTDYPDTVCTIRGIPRSVATSGCAATSLSMVIAYLTGNTDQNPSVLFCDSVANGLYQGAGWSHATLSHYASKYGVKSKWIGNYGSEIRKALSEGKPIIAHMGPGIFTSRGHYIVLRGLTSDGKVLVNDPVSPSKCRKAFPMSTILAQCKGSHAFMVCWVDDPADDIPVDALLTDEAEEIEAGPEETAGEADDTYAAGTAVVRENSARVREDASKDAAVIATIEIGTEVELIEQVIAPEDGCTWWKIRYDGRTGYIHGDLIEVVQ